jgi:hypothetical protein
VSHSSLDICPTTAGWDFTPSTIMEQEQSLSQEDSDPIKITDTMAKQIFFMIVFFMVILMNCNFQHFDRNNPYNGLNKGSPTQFAFLHPMCIHNIWYKIA